MKTTSAEPVFLRFGIILLTMTTALIHLALNFLMGKFDIIFTLNGIGYLVLLSGLNLDIQPARENRRLIRFTMIAFTIITLVGWIAIGDKTWWVGWATKTVEVFLIILLLLKRP